jgi:hypothetical protein
MGEEDTDEESAGLGILQRLRPLHQGFYLVQFRSKREKKFLQTPKTDKTCRQQQPEELAGPITNSYKGCSVYAQSLN